MSGLVHIYCGDGKGKTTAAVGAAVRAAGRGKRVIIARFLKTDDSGELISLEAIPRITVLPSDQNFGFSWQMSPESRKAAGLYYTENFKIAWRMVLGEDEDTWEAGASEIQAGSGCDMLVLDEIIGAVDLGFVEEEDLLAALKKRPDTLEVILTGRNPSKALCSQADYITEMKMHKHPYTKGVSAREGIEY